MTTDILAQLLDAKHELLAQIQQLAQRQVEWVESGDVSRLLNLLSVKQRLLNELQVVDRRLDPFREQDAERRVWRCSEDRQRARDVAARCETLLAAIVRIEKTCETEMLRRRDETSTRLQGAHFATQAASAYLPTMPNSGGHFDASCES